MILGNTIENKAQFYGLYLGAELGNRKIFTDPQELTINNFATVVRFSSAPLMLTSPSDITEEDAFRVAIIASIFFSKEKVKRDRTLNYVKNNIYLLCTQSNVSDYLRSRKYAIDWMGLSIEDQIKYGWTKLRKNENSQENTENCS